MSIIKNNDHTLQENYESPRQYNANIKDDIALSTSHAGAASSFINNNNPYHTTHNPAFQASVHINAQNLSRAAHSADTYLSSSIIFARMQARPKALINPFAPASIRIPMVPGRRRWAHTFPIGKMTHIYHLFHINF